MEVSQEITSQFCVNRPLTTLRIGTAEDDHCGEKPQPATAFSFGIGFPASRASTSFTARCAARIPALVVDSGPSESVLAKKTRSRGWRTSGCTCVNSPGVDIYKGCPRR